MLMTVIEVPERLSKLTKCDIMSAGVCNISASAFRVKFMHALAQPQSVFVENRWSLVGRAPLRHGSCYSLQNNHVSCNTSTNDSHYVPYYLFWCRVLAGILYPAYSSFKAVRRKSHREYVSTPQNSPVRTHSMVILSLNINHATNTPHTLSLSQTKWMMYWIVFAIFMTVEVVTDTFLAW